MLRQLLGQPEGEHSRAYRNVDRAIGAFRRRIDKRMNGMKPPTQKEYRLHLWADGFMEALEELEESIFCSEHYGRNVTKRTLQEMNPEEEADYRRYNYFFKNGFIRVFSILDKLGSFLNDMFELKAETIKPHFSYFTTLRQMHKLQIEPALEERLYELKNRCKEPLDRLRKLRNLEVHWMNTELYDDLLRKRHTFSDPISVENVALHVSDMRQAYDFVCQSLLAVFTYCSDNNCLIGND